MAAASRLASSRWIIRDSELGAGQSTEARRPRIRRALTS